MFEVGRRVKYIKEFEDNSRDLYKIGTIIQERAQSLSSTHTRVLLIEFENSHWWVPNSEEYLQLEKKDKSWHNNKLKFRFINGDR